MIRMSECAPGQQTATRYQEMGLVHNQWIQNIALTYRSVKRSSSQNTVSTIIDSQKGSNIGPPQQSPIYCSWANPTNPAFWNYEGITIAYIKSRRSEDYLGPEMRLKTIRVKTELLELIWKLEYLGLSFWRLELRWLNWNLLKKMRNGI